MKRYLTTIALLLATLFHGGEAAACTSAVVVASRSTAGVPMLWKHRDSANWDCHIEYVEGEKYGFTALVPQKRKMAYCGINERGFAIINTVSSNLTKDYSVSNGGGALHVMWSVLGICATVEEFEAWLAATNGKRSYVTNFAVGDASGALAYFEVWCESFKRYDTAECEGGFDVRSNFSRAGDMAKPDSSVPRYEIAMRNMTDRERYSPYEFFDYSRSYEQSDGRDVLDAYSNVVIDDTTVARYTSAAATVALCDAENPRMLVTVGHPVAGIVVPVYVKAKGAIPACVSGHGNGSSKLADEFREKAYRKLSKMKQEINKPLIKQVQEVVTRCAMPRRMPRNIDRFNAAVDARFEKHAARVREILARY